MGPSEELPAEEEPTKLTDSEEFDALADEIIACCDRLNKALDRAWQRHDMRVFMGQSRGKDGQPQLPMQLHPQIFRFHKGSFHVRVEPHFEFAWQPVDPLDKSQEEQAV